MRRRTSNSSAPTATRAAIRACAWSPSAYLAVLPEIGAVTAGTDAARAELVAVDALLGPKPARRLAFDHDLILADAVAHAREKLSTTSLATAFVGPEFTLGDLREVYEAAWGVELDPANFRRKVLATEGFVMPTGRRAVSGPKAASPPRPIARSAARACIRHCCCARPMTRSSLGAVPVDPASSIRIAIARPSGASGWVTTQHSSAR